jgi:uncharacterized protein
MKMSHEWLVLIHLIGAVLFVGAIALEVFILEPIKRDIGVEGFQKFEFYLFRAIKRRYWPGVLALYVTGFVMFFSYMDTLGGVDAMRATDFGKVLILKAVLAVGLLGIFLTAPFLFMRKQPNPLKHFFVITGKWEDFRIDRFEVVHYAALTLGLALVVLGKVLWMV